MSHPDDAILADYVDGTLPPSERADVDAHLAGCASCRSDVALARDAASALRRLPEVDTPPGPVDTVLREAELSGARPRWTRVVPIAAAAVLVGILAISLPHLTSGSDQQHDAAAALVPDLNGGAARLPFPSVDGPLQHIPSVERVGANYEQAAIGSLAAAAADAYRGQELPARVPVTATTKPTAGEASITGDLSSAAADACVHAQVPVVPGDLLVRLIDASYRGKRAYVAVFVHAPVGGGPIDRVSVYVVTVAGCRLVNAVDRPI